MTIGEAVDAGTDIDQFAGDAIELLRKILLTKMSGSPDIFSFDLDAERKKKLGEWAEAADTTTLVRTIEALLEKRKDLKTAHPPQLPLELGAVELCERISYKPERARTETTTPAAPTPSVATVVPRSPEPAIQSAAEGAGAKEGKKTVAKAAEAPRAEVRTDGDAVRSVDQLKALWTDFIKRVGEVNASLPYILVSAEPVSVAGAHISVGFGYTFHRDKFNEEKCLRIAEKAMEELLETPVRMAGVLLDKKPEMGHADGVLTSARQADPASAGGDALAAAFGGQVVE
jgi:hypothetical protein